MQGSKVACAIVASDLECAQEIALAAFNYPRSKFFRVWESGLFSDERLQKLTKGHTGYFTGVMEEKIDAHWKFVSFNIRHHYIDIALKWL